MRSRPCGRSTSREPRPEGQCKVFPVIFCMNQALDRADCWARGFAAGAEELSLKICNIILTVQYQFDCRTGEPNFRPGFIVQPGECHLAA
jgi:hypothetical protein